jgi:SAM-dependent methyltransferase
MDLRRLQPLPKAQRMLAYDELHLGQGQVTRVDVLSAGASGSKAESSPAYSLRVGLFGQKSEDVKMHDQDPWHSQDAFWELFGSVLFSQQRQRSAIAEVEKIEKLLGIGEQARILDICCGNGRHSLELSQRGFEVIGVDRTAAYIQTARSKAEKRGLDVEFVIGDVREYCVPNSFDIVLNLFGSFGYFEDPEDDRRVVENVYASLRPGGRFLIETQGKEILARDFREKDWVEECDLLILSEKKVSQNWGRIETRWIVIRGRERVEHRVSVRSYSAVELSSLLARCDFCQVRVYGSLEGTEYDQSAQRLVVVGYK